MTLSQSKTMKTNSNGTNPGQQKVKTIADKKISKLEFKKRKPNIMTKKGGKDLDAPKKQQNKTFVPPPGIKKIPLKIDVNKTSGSAGKLSTNGDSKKQLKDTKKEEKGEAGDKSVKNSVKSTNEKTTDMQNVSSGNLAKPIGKVAKTGKTKKTLTHRQLHKRKKLMEKRKAMRTEKKGSKSKGKKGTKKALETSDSECDKKTVKDSDPNDGKVKEKIVLPKTVDEATLNWRKLQMTMKTGKGGLKRKKDPLKVRNPKYQKLDEKSITERFIQEVTKKEDKSSGIWFDDVDEIFIDNRHKEGKEEVVDTDAVVQNDDTSSTTKDNELVKPEAFKGVTSIVGIDCEMVGIKNNESTLARVSIVNRYGEPVYDKFVKPTEKVTDYRTHVSGIRPEDLKNGQPFKKVRKEVADILKGRILIGHALTNDFKALKLRHPPTDVRDTSVYPPFRALFNGKTPGLRKLTAKVLAVKIQGGEHNSIQDAQAAVRLYTMHRTQWEAECKTKGSNKRKTKGLKKVNEKDPADNFKVVDRLWNV